MRSTMQDVPLLISSILRRGESVYSDSEVVTYDGPGQFRRASFGQIGENSARLANGLRSLGVTGDARVGTFCFNHQEHLEAYLGIPSMGAVLHTLNLRLFPEQLTYIVNHAEDQAIIIDGMAIPLIGKVAGTLTGVKHFIVVGEGDHSMLTEAFPGAAVHSYDALLTAQSASYAWPTDLDERDAAAICYTSGTTGNPKGVAYSHRSAYLHSMGLAMASVSAVTEHDKVLVIVPQFHANAWGFPYAGFMVGADFLMPRQFLQAAPLAEMIRVERPTVSLGVPTIWNDLYTWGEANPGQLDMSSMRMVTAGGSAVPKALMQKYFDTHGVKIVQGWGMTETSPLASLGIPPKSAKTSDEEWRYRDMAGRVLPCVEVRITDDDGTVLPNDGQAIGEIEVQGPWITGAYLKDPAPEKFRDGWLRTGDMATMDDKGFIKITDRTKDVIKSGGEWVSSIDLENAIMAHPSVASAAVIGIPDAKWDERPLACVVVKPGIVGDAALISALKDHLGERVAKWWIPERWSFVDAVPLTSVGKFDKKVLRSQYAEGTLADVIEA